MLAFLLGQAWEKQKARPRVFLYLERAEKVGKTIAFSLIKRNGQFQLKEK